MIANQKVTSYKPGIYLPRIVTVVFELLCLIAFLINMESLMFATMLSRLK